MLWCSVIAQEQPGHMWPYERHSGSEVEATGAVSQLCPHSSSF